MESLTTNTNEDISFIELSLSPGDDESWERCETIMDVVRPDCVLVTVQAGSHAQRMKSWLDFAEAIEGCSMVLTGIDIDGIPGEHVYGMAERNIPLAFLTHGATSPLHVSAASGANVTAAVFRTR
jgi:flagellar biosynthesis GTPase FlhF